MTYPNQLKIKIHKPKYDDEYVKENGAFMQIGVDEWQEAYRSVKGNASAMGMYFYLASNKNGFEKFLSSADFENVVGKSRSSYHRGIDLLKEKGYIYKDASGCLNFATIPQESCEVKIHKWEQEDANKGQGSSKKETAESQKCNEPKSNLNIEIKKTNNNKENKELKKASPSSPSSYEYLKEIIKPNGNFVKEKDKWLEDEVPMLWTLVKARDKRLAREIYQNTEFALEEAIHIANNILSWNSRMYTIRDGDF